MNIKKYIYLIIALAMTGSLVSLVPVFAQTAQPGQNNGRSGGGMMNRGQAPAVMGTVSAISGNTITVSGRQGFNNATAATTFTVDATNAKVTKNNTASTVANIAVGDTVVVQGTVNGTNVTATAIRDGVMAQGNRAGMGIAGTVSAINGTNLTVTSKATPNGGTATTYTVDASNATVTKNGNTSSVSGIAVGDTIMVQGTVTGTSVVAKTIRDGVVQIQPAIQGNGQPVVAGAVTLISGNTITITNKSNVTYTIDASAAKFVIPGVTSPAISDVAVGDNLTVQGTVNGNSVVASYVIDQKVKSKTGENNTGDNQKSKQGFFGGILGGISSFFKNLFGF
jgi:hypothetical protein